MLSSAVDLTANRDFGGLRMFFLPDISVEMIDDDYMSCEEYEVLKYWENIFGKKRHRNQKVKVFGHKYIHNIKDNCECYRCGKPIKLPWKNHGGICEACNTIIQAAKIPWSRKYRNIIPSEAQESGQSTIFDDITMRNLFNRR